MEMTEKEVRELFREMSVPLISRIDSQQKEIETLKDGRHATEIWQAKMSVSMENLDKKLDEFMSEFKEYSSKPQKRWDSLVAAVLATTVSVIINLVFKR